MKYVIVIWATARYRMVKSIAKFDGFFKSFDNF